jgi:hypothetical protein
MQISEYLDHEPQRSNARIRDLEILADEVAHRPLADVLEDLRGVLKDRPLSGGDHQRLHILLSQLYHASADVDQALVDRLRAEVTGAWEVNRSHMHLSDRSE